MLTVPIAKKKDVVSQDQNYLKIIRYHVSTLSGTKKGPCKKFYWSYYLVQYTGASLEGGQGGQLTTLELWTYA